jgi:hypothetical protein
MLWTTIDGMSRRSAKSDKIEKKGAQQRKTLPGEVREGRVKNTNKGRISEIDTRASLGFWSLSKES